jgi:hypothetical protein
MPSLEVKVRLEVVQPVQPDVFKAVVVVVDVDVVVPNADMMYGTIFTKQDATFTYIYIKICKC